MTDYNAMMDGLGETPFDRLVRVMEILRSPEGCSWDREQTHKSLLPYLIEETYEVVEAIESGQPGNLAEELGDLLCQVVFHAQLARERGEFEIDDAVTHIVEKLIRRHPHVFGDKKDLKPQEVRDQWEKIKSESVEKRSVLEGLPKSMPALTTAFRIGEKAGGVGFDWQSAEEAMGKVREELAEIESELKSSEDGRKERLTDEIGDLLFAIASVSRKLSIDPESALRRALGKFRRRFNSLERIVKADGGSFSDHELAQLETIWQKIKQSEKVDENKA